MADNSSEEHGTSAVDIPGNTVNNAQILIDSNNPNSGESDSSAVKADNDDDGQAKVHQLPMLTDKGSAQDVPIVHHEDIEVDLMEDGSETVKSVQNALKLPTEELMTVPINSPQDGTLLPSDVEHNMKENSESQSESRKEDGVTSMEISEEIPHVPNVNSAEEEKEVAEELLTTEKDREVAEIICDKEIVSDERVISDEELSSGKKHICSTNVISDQEVNTISGVCAESLIETDNCLSNNKMDDGVDSLTAVPSVEKENNGPDENQQATDNEAAEVLPELDTSTAQNTGDKRTESFKESEENSENASTEHMENDSAKQCVAEKVPGSYETNNSQTESTSAEILESCVPSDTKQIPSSPACDDSMENAGSSMENASCNSSAEKLDHAGDSEHSESQNSLTTVDIVMADTDDNNVDNSSSVNQTTKEMGSEVGNQENSNKAKDKTQFSVDEQAEGIGKVHKVEENSMDTTSEDDSKRTECRRPGPDDATDKTSGKENEDENGKDSEDSKANIPMIKAKEEKSAQVSQNNTEETGSKSTNAVDSNTTSSSMAKLHQKAAKSAQQSKAAKHQECVVCKKVAKCKYNIVRNDDTKHLCDDKCFQMFRAQPTAYLQSDAKKAGATTTESCHQCQKTISANAKGKHTLKTGKDNQKFCSAACLNSFKKQIKPCASCGKDLRNDVNAFVAPVEGEGYKDFCGHACLVKYEHSKKQATKEEDDDDDVEIVEATPAPKSKPVLTTGSRSSGRSKCVICTKMSNVRHEANYKGQIHKLCSDACLSAFRVMHNLAMNQCDNCCSLFSLDEAQVQTIQFEGASKTFCSSLCLSEFKTKKQRIVQCTWCNTCKSNFDMVERLDANNKYQMFCSLNCLSLYRVNLQANSNQSVVCDQCRKRAPAQYHLTMSDASVRNFCGYSCVVSFQAQFSQPSATSSQIPMPGNQVTANAANTQPAQSTVAATPPKRSHYGTRHSSRVAAQSTLSPLTVASPPTPMPVISNIVSLAAPTSTPPVPQQTDVSKTPAKSVGHIGVQTMAPQEVIVQPPPPKQVKNKALLCKPYMQTKATSCRPHTVGKGCQTEENWEPKKMLVPCPVPTVTPAPMMMFSNPMPYPIILPIPVPIPVFIPTTKKSTAGIMKKIKELQERVPSDPFEAELLMMAEAVANANKVSESASESEDEDNDAGSAHLVSAESTALPPVHSQATNGELAEDMLQMALRMAEMQSEPNLDLEDAVDPTPVRARESLPVVSMPVFDTIAADNDILQASHMISTPRGGSARGRGKRRGGSRGGRSSSVAKKPRVDEETSETAPVPVMTSPVIAEPPADANCVLKFTYGVNAYKHWAIQKNSQLERIAPPKTGARQRLFKLDLLQCSADELNYALCLFVKEVRKPNGEEYAPDSIFYLCLGIQEYLYENGRIDNIFTDFFYEKFTECLNEVLNHYEVRLNAQGMLVCRIEEEHLWEAKQLGAHSPHVLLNTLIYFNTKHFMLRTAEEHLGLSFSHIMKHWKKTSTPAGKPGRSVYLRYYAPSQMGAGEAAQKRKKEELPVFEQAENVENPLRCPVKLYEFYLSKCPESIKNRSDVFYLVPERSCVPDSPVWYSTLSLGVEGMTRMLNRLRVVREIQESQLTSLSVPYYN